MNLWLSLLSIYWRPIPWCEIIREPRRWRQYGASYIRRCRLQEFNIGLLVVAGSALVLGLLSKPLKRCGLPDSITLVLIGVVVGPIGFGFLVPEDWGEPMLILEQVARLALAVGLMGVALQLPKNYLFKHWRSLALVLVLGMPFMWLCSSAIAGSMLGLSLGAALLIGAIVTPTDPVVASTIVTGPVAKDKLPAYLREIISAEAGANDGLAYLFVMVGVFVLTLPSGESMTAHVLAVLFGDVLSALLLGVIIGSAAGYCLRKAEEKDLIEQPSILMITTALALATLAGVALLGSDGILAVFVAGLAFDQQVDRKNQQREERVVQGVDRFFTSPIFILLGLMIPWDEWLLLGWSGLAVAGGMLLFRRLPLFLLLGGRIESLPGRADGTFAGWFGPIGVAALYYVAMAHHEAHVSDLWPITSLIVVLSILVHGLTATPFSRFYKYWRNSRRPV